MPRNTALVRVLMLKATRKRRVNPALKSYIGRDEHLRALMNREHHVVIALSFSANHIASLGLARDELERKR